MAPQSPKIVGFLSFTPADTSMPSSDALTRISSSDDTGAVLAAPLGAAGPATASGAAQLFALQDLGTGRSFIHPLYVSVEQNGDEWSALSADLGLVGFGESDLDALDDLRSQIGELFESLVEMRSELGPAMRNQLAFLERLSG